MEGGSYRPGGAADIDRPGGAAGRGRPGVVVVGRGRPGGAVDIEPGGAVGRGQLAVEVGTGELWYSNNNHNEQYKYKLYGFEYNNVSVLRRYTRIYVQNIYLKRSRMVQISAS